MCVCVERGMCFCAASFVLEGGTLKEQQNRRHKRNTARTPSKKAPPQMHATFHKHDTTHATRVAIHSSSTTPPHLPTTTPYKPPPPPYTTTIHHHHTPPPHTTTTTPPTGRRPRRRRRALADRPLLDGVPRAAAVRPRDHGCGARAPCCLLLLLLSCLPLCASVCASACACGGACLAWLVVALVAPLLSSILTARASAAASRAIGIPRWPPADE